MGFGGRWTVEELAAKTKPKALPAPVPAAKKAKAKPAPVFGPPQQSEYALQVSCHQHYKTYCPSLNWLVPQADGSTRESGLGFMCKNDGKKKAGAARRDMAQGLTPGVPDWQLTVAGRGYHGLLVEFKTLTGKASPAQKLMHKALELQGYYVVIITTLPDFGKLLAWYLGPKVYRLTW